LTSPWIGFLFFDFASFWLLCIFDALFYGCAHFSTHDLRIDKSLAGSLRGTWRIGLSDDDKHIIPLTKTRHHDWVNLCVTLGHGATSLTVRL